MMPEVLWDEGMLLRPHHLQLLQRHCAGLIGQLARLRPFSFGIYNLDILREAVGNWVLEVVACELVMPDGTLVVKDRTAVLKPVEFRRHGAEDPILEVWLAVPFHSDTGANVLGGEGGEGGSGRRYHADLISVRNENSGGDSQEVGVRRLNVKIFVGTRPPQGHATLKIAELKKVVTDDAGGGRYELSGEFVPPCQSMEASRTLSGIVKDLLHRLEEKNQELLAKLRNRRDLLAGGSPEPEALLKLQATNGVLPVLRQLAGQPGMHPFDVYLQLSRLIGDLAIFSENWEPPKLVLYDHEDPLKAYLDLKRQWLALLERAVETTIAHRPFQASAALADALEVEIPAAFLTEEVELLLGVETELDPTEALPHLEQARLCAPEDLDECRRTRTLAIPCRREPNLHPALRGRDGWLFLRIERRGERWESARRAQRLALDARTLGRVGKKFELHATNVHSGGGR